MIVFEQQVIQGTVTSRSIVLPDPTPRDFVGSVFESTPHELIDAAFSFTLALQWSINPGVWHQPAIRVYSFGKPVTVTWPGVAQYVRLILDPIRPCSLGIAITY